MSKYTTELRYVCENYAGYDESKDYASISDVISKSRNKIFDFDYPIFDENYRSVLETKIIRHFYLREICAETIGVWKHFLDMRMNEIMPYYNKLYESELIEFNPLYDVDLTKDYNKDDKGTGTLADVLHSTDNRDISKTEGEARHLSANGTDTGTITDTGTVKDTGTVTNTGTDTNAKTGSDTDVKKNKRWDIYSDTPQGGLTNVENEEYLTNARKITDDGTGSQTTYNSTNTETKNLTNTNNLTKTNDLTRTNNLANSNTEDETNNRTSRIDDDNTKDSTNTQTRNLRDIEDYLEHIKGKSPGASFSKFLQEFRDTFLNIDVMIINDLNDLFFGLW